MQYKFKKGITDSQINQLIEYSKTDSVILKFTSDPIRFKNKKSALKWFNHVTAYTLVDKNNSLIGLTWFHEKPLPERVYSENLNPNDFPLTFAIRVYGNARGQGLSYDFMKRSFDEFKPESIWIETSYNNIPTIKLAKKLDFEKVTESDKRGKIILIRIQPLP